VANLRDIILARKRGHVTSAIKDIKPVQHERSTSSGRNIPSKWFCSLTVAD